MTVRAAISALIPRVWTGQQALRAVRHLQLAIDIIWWIHADAMAAVLLTPPERAPVAPPKSATGDDDLPF